MRRSLIGSLVGVVASVAVAAALVPFRPHLSIATDALVLVVPVVAGVAVGGFGAGMVSVGAGFLVYDWTFIPPYRTLSVGSGQNWIALGVYAVVLVLVARVVSIMDRARGAAASREASARHLLGLSELLLAERPAAELGASLVAAVRERLGVDGAALLRPADGGLAVVASSGEPLGAADLEVLGASRGLPVHLSTARSTEPLQAVALSAPSGPVGLLVLRGVPADPALREVLPILGNHLALALERAQLRERALRAEVLEELDAFRRALLGAVSHDLRTPLATIKVASSTLLEAGRALAAEDADELCQLIDTETDRLGRLVGGLLDMTRLQAGVLGVQARPVPVPDLLEAALAGRRATLGDRPVRLDVAGGLPAVVADRLLIGQVLANLIDNAQRFGPEGSPITLAAAPLDGGVAVSVTDEGPGVPPGEREAVFDSFVRFEAGGRAGLGLWIAKTFVDAHGQRIWVEDGPASGSRFVFTLAPAPAPAPASPRPALARPVRSA